MFRFVWIVLLMAAAAALSVGTGVAWAHPFLIRATPLPDAVLRFAPAEVVLAFSESLNVPASRIVVTARQQRSVSRGAARPVAGHSQELEVSLDHLPAGSYVVTWTAVSANDGHIVNGAYIFSVGHRDQAVVLPIAPADTGGEFGLGSSQLLAIVAHWIVLAAAIIWVGAAAVSPLVKTPSAQTIRHVRQVERVRLRQLVRYATGMLVIGSCAELLIQAHILAGRGWLSTFSGTTISALLAEQYGHLWLVRQGIALTALLATFAPLDRSVAAPGREQRAVAGERGSLALHPPFTLPLGFVYLYALAASGHAASVSLSALPGSGLVSVAILVDWSHLLGVAVWFGGQAYIALVLTPAFGVMRKEPVSSAPLLQALDRFSPAAYAGIAVLAVAGLFNSAVHIPSWDVLLSSVYGLALLVKLGLTSLMIVVSAFTGFVLRSRLRRLPSVTAVRDHGTGDSAMRTLVRWLRVNPVLGMGVLLATSVMFFYPVPPELSSSPLSTHWQPAGLLGATVHSLALGSHQPELAFAGTDGGVYRRGTDGAWRLVLAIGSVWNVQLLSDDRTVLAADLSGHVDISTDDGVHWSRRFVQAGGVWAVSVQPGVWNHILAGASGGIYSSLDGGRTWHRRLSLGNAAATAFAWEHHGSTAFAGTVIGWNRTMPHVFVSRDAGRHWSVFGTGLNSGGGIMSLAVAPPGAVFAGTMGHAAWRAFDRNPVWQQVADGLPATPDHIAALTPVSGHPPVLYAATLGQGAFRSVDGGRRWRTLSTGLPAESGSTIVLSLAYSPRQHRLYAGTINGVYELSHPEALR